MDTKHLQRMEQLLKIELRKMYEQISFYKAEIESFWDAASKDDPSRHSRLSFQNLNYSRTLYRKYLERAKALEQTQREIRKQIRKGN